MEDKQGAYLFPFAHFWLLVRLLFLSASPQACFFSQATVICFRSLSWIYFAVLPTLAESAYYVPSETLEEPAIIPLLAGLSPSLINPSSELRDISTIWQAPPTVRPGFQFDGVPSKIIQVLIILSSFLSSSKTRNGSYCLQLLFPWYHHVLFFCLFSVLNI